MSNGLHGILSSYHARLSFISGLKQTVLTALSLVSLTIFSTQAISADTDADQILAVVGDEIISLTDYHIMMRNESRRRFYHGKAAESQMEAFRKEIADMLIDQALLISEARRRGISENKNEITRQMQQYAEKARAKNVVFDESKPLWKSLHERLVRENMITQLKTSIKVDTNPDKELLYAFYKKNPQIFTEPERLRVSIILLKVPPSAAQETWTAARNEAARLVERIKKGENFADLARVHSADASANNGGDMGYLHQGMLSEDVQKKMHDIKPGEMAEPITVLEGIVIVKLEDRTPAKLNNYDDVADKVKAMWYRETGQKAWDSLLVKLRRETNVVKGKNYPVGNNNKSQENKPLSGYRFDEIYRLRGSSRIPGGTRLSGNKYDKTEIARHASCSPDIADNVVYASYS